MRFNELIWLGLVDNFIFGAVFLIEYYWRYQYKMKKLETTEMKRKPKDDKAPEI